MNANDQGVFLGSKTQVQGFHLVFNIGNKHRFYECYLHIKMQKKFDEDKRLDISVFFEKLTKCSTN